MTRIRVLPRRAFTLMELLVTISIIGVLFALGAAAVGKFWSAQQTSSTRKLLHRLDMMLRTQITTTNDRAMQQGGWPASVDALAGGDPDKARVLWLKLRLKQKYPSTFAEVFNPAPGFLSPVPAYVEYLRQYGITAANVAAQPLAHQSAACLLMALSIGPDAIAEEELGVGGSTKTINGVPCLVDSWGNPLTFTRWPSGEAGTGASIFFTQGYLGGYTDPADPKNVLIPWANSVQGFANVLHPVPAQRPTANSRPVVLSPMIVSWGPDGLLGADPRTLQSDGTTDSDDNVYSIEQK